MTTIKIVPMPGAGIEGPQGPAGDSAYDVAVANGFEGTEQEWLDSLSANTGPEIIPLPDFLTYEEGRTTLPTLNENFGWDSNGVWFGPTAMDGDPEVSYPIFSSFTLSETDKVEVSFSIEIEEFCSDAGVCVYLDGTVPLWSWEPNSTRIAAQFNCPSPEISGIESTVANSEGESVPEAGTYRMIFIYDPTAESEKVTFQYYNILDDQTILSSITLNESLPSGNYRIGLASDNDGDVGGPFSSSSTRTYISNLTIIINDNEETTYFDSLQNGSSGEPEATADTADFTFRNLGDYDPETLSGGESSISLHNKDFTIKTTRDELTEEQIAEFGNIDADITLSAADDIFITAQGDDATIEAMNDVRIVTDYDEIGNTWEFSSEGRLYLPNSTEFYDEQETVVTQESRSISTPIDYLGNSPTNNATAVFLEITETSSWMADNFSNRLSSTITFGDSEVLPLIAVYQVDLGGTPVAVFQWDGSRDVAWPVQIDQESTVYEDIASASVRVPIPNSESEFSRWIFSSDGSLTLPRSGIISNGNGDIVLDADDDVYLRDSSVLENRVATLGDISSIQTQLDNKAALTDLDSKLNSTNPQITISDNVTVPVVIQNLGTYNGPTGTSYSVYDTHEGYEELRNWAIANGASSNIGEPDIRITASVTANGISMQPPAGNWISGTTEVSLGISSNSVGFLWETIPFEGNSAIYDNPTFTIGTPDIGISATELSYLDGATSNIQDQLNLKSEISQEIPFTVNGGTLGTQPTFNGAPLFSGTYVKNGPLVHFQIQVDMDNITSFGTGQYYVDLPFPAKYGYKFREGCLHDISASKDYEIGGHIDAGQSRLNLTSTDTQSGKVFDIPFVYNDPIVLSIADNFHISGTYITAS